MDPHFPAPDATDARMPARELRELLGTLVDLLPLCIALLDDHGRLLYVNTPGQDLFGTQHPSGQSVANDCAACVPAEGHQQTWADGLRIAQQAGSWQGEMAFRAPGGRDVPCAIALTGHRQDDGRIRFVSLVAHDLTAQRRTSQMLREQAALLEKAHDAVIVKTLEGRIERWSAGAERIYGWETAEVIGRSAEEVLRPDNPTYAEALQKTRDHGSWNGELGKRAKDGRDLRVDSRWTLIRHANGEPECILSIDADITEQKKLEARFLRSQRLESIGTLAGGIAHDLNNILAPILMAVGLLRLKINDPAGLDTLNTLEYSAQRGADLVRQVLGFARGAEGQRGPVSVARLLRDVQKIVSETFPKSIQCSVVVPSEPWNVQGDITQLHQVLLNVCLNARDAMPSGGRLELVLDNFTVDDGYNAMNPESRQGPYVRIRITDTGTGMTPEVRERCFEPFFTTKPQGQGTGLGLSTVYSIVKGHGGFINVYSEVGKGTQIKFYLPAQPGMTEVARAPAPAPSPWGRGETILVVDDEDNVGLITQRILERHGYRTLHARNGAEAIAEFARSNPPVDLVLTDMAMPIMDGPATIIALRKIRPDVRIVGASGLGSNNRFAHAIGAGLHYFLHKPYTAEKLLETVRQALDEPAAPPPEK